MNVILAQVGGSGGNLFSMLLPLILIFGIFYLLIIRPERKKQKQQQRRFEEMLEALKKNDKVVTKGGIHGVVRAVRADDVLLVIDEANNTRLKLDKRSISRVITKEGGELSDRRS